MITYFTWSKMDPNDPRAGVESPNLQEILKYLRAEFGGSSLGIAGKRDQREHPGVKSTHYWGAALDYRNVDRSVMLHQVIPFLIENHELLGVQMVADYIGCRVWRVGRTDSPDGWKVQPKSSFMGASWATFLHIETTPSDWANNRPIADRIADAFNEPQLAFPPFAPDFGLFSVWPILPKPRIAIGASGDVVRYLQGVLRKAGHGLAVDGAYGKVTSDHVRWFQMVNKLTSDGVVGPKTWAVIDRVASS